uniref:Uncharacterized protein n=1 Tax=Astyanax mexicanus TaxID=7994 RepID=A0A3B1K6F2_ASTMX
TTAEDYSSEVPTLSLSPFKLHHDEELQPPVSPLEEELQQAESPGRMRAVEDELAAKSLAVEELSRELEEIRAAFGAEGVQQLQDFEAALKQRDGIITQLTANLQQARMEKDEVMREFLQLTEQSQKLQLQFQQLQAGESLRSSSISSTAADLLQSRQQVLLYQQQLEQRDVQVRAHLMQLDERDGEVKGLQMQLDERDGEVKGLQMQLDERDAEVSSLQMQVDERDTEVKSLQEKLLQTKVSEQWSLERPLCAELLARLVTGRKGVKIVIFGLI